ncbi:type II/IV secretion system ATPase subunit [Thermoproteus tenax]|uniref:Type II/IV secretion system, ATPase component, VirB11/GspE family n=1 Tax=Thermoproteus tenax (strain ATCC 35583 / DSM 2078 / JCM 9277 / NBRC 100435 / Kra 1) TaxID=768679 RepID=G4RJM9_THETK|nr:type II/IV secretion system ATPase subunit [Thermoproteus tenax]CCC81774.1 Type II/IV secretion system, ATPase component, VirB11/GspE family [Thermoproteus tenax Kra 1]
MGEVLKLLEEYEVAQYVHVMIYVDKHGFRAYRAVEPPLSDEERELLLRLKRAIQNVGDVKDGILKLTRERREEYLAQLVDRAAREFKLNVEEERRGKIMYYLRRDLLGYGVLDPLVRDPFVEDIHFDGPGVPIYVWHSRWESLRTDIVLDLAEADAYVQRFSALVGKPVSYADPILEGMLPEGYRLELVAPPSSPRGPSFVIRKFFVEPITLIDLVKMGTISAEAVAYLWLMLDYGRNIVILGPTGAGKTTLLNALLHLIRPDAKVLTIEDTREINIVHEHWQALLTRPSRSEGVRDVSAFDLLAVAMRSRPDYVVVGEIRGEEAYVLFQAFGSGHAGATTMHAETIEDAVRRLLTRPMSVPPMLIGLAHVFVRIMRVKIGERIARRVVEIAENMGIARGGRPRLNYVFRWSPEKDSLERVGESRHLETISRVRFVPMDALLREFERRKELIGEMVKQGFSSP